MSGECGGLTSENWDSWKLKNEKSLTKMRSGQTAGLERKSRDSEKKVWLERYLLRKISRPKGLTLTTGV